MSKKVFKLKKDQYLSDLELIIMADGNGNASNSPEIIGIADPVN